MIAVCLWPGWDHVEGCRGLGTLRCLREARSDASALPLLRGSISCSGGLLLIRVLVGSGMDGLRCRSSSLMGVEISISSIRPNRLACCYIPMLPDLISTERLDRRGHCATLRGFKRRLSEEVSVRQNAEAFLC